MSSSISAMIGGGAYFPQDITAYTRYSTTSGTPQQVLTAAENASGIELLAIRTFYGAEIYYDDDGSGGNKVVLVSSVGPSSINDALFGIKVPAGKYLMAKGSGTGHPAHIWYKVL